MTATMVGIPLINFESGIFAGVMDRPIFTYKDSDQVYIGSGWYEINGKIVYWSSQLTSVAISGAANNTFYYLYLDDSEIGTTPYSELVASDFIWSTTAPTWSAAKRGWYNSNDRCVFSILTSAAGSILYFNHDGGNKIIWENHLVCGQTSKVDYDFSNIDVDTTWDDVYCVAPDFSTKVNVTMYSYWGASTGAYTTSLWRRNGSSGTGHLVGAAYYTAAFLIGTVNTFDAATDTGQIIEVKNSVSTNTTIYMYTNGWYFPKGM